jgi:hypothetical protein
MIVLSFGRTPYTQTNTPKTNNQQINLPMKTTVPPRTGRTYATHNNQKSISPTHHTGLHTNERPCTDNAHVEMTPSLSNPTLEPHALFCPIEKGTAPLTTAPPLRALFTQSTGPNTAKNETQKQQQLRNNNVMSGCARCTLSHSDARLLSPPKSRLAAHTPARATQPPGTSHLRRHLAFPKPASVPTFLCLSSILSSIYGIICISSSSSLKLYRTVVITTEYNHE